MEHPWIAELFRLIRVPVYADAIVAVLATGNSRSPMDGTHSRHLRTISRQSE